MPINLAVMAPLTGLEPVTDSLEGYCSIQLSYKGMVSLYSEMS